MHGLATAFVLGYHGCDQSVAEGLLNGAAFQPSTNGYDWLGHGAYFWEANPRRGLEFAREQKARHATGPGVIQTPAVVGAVIEIGFCLDLISSTGIAAVRDAHEDFCDYLGRTGAVRPTNHFGRDLLLRDLDCAVINHLHMVRKKAGLPAYQTVRGVFIEGERIYENAGFFEKTHVQLCVREPSCIKGVFRVPPEHLQPS